ncbi:MAG: GNAT family N-acetyltransferase, partial [Acidobacteria bacterium]|nr:GNAT family N-acetyltransferase [Acidobacteriota bacterium]
MEKTDAIPLRDGRTLDIEVLTFPIDSARQTALIGLWRTEWTGGDYDWLRSMNGDYSRHLRIQAVLGTIEGRPAGTASVCYPCLEPEVSVVGSVLTHPDCRRLGVAEALTSAVVDLSFRAGCRVSYLGATRDPRNVYLRCGFRWWNGGVMRLEREDSSGCEEDFFAPGQATSVRQANWGDLAAFACFVVQPWDTLVLDYPRALLS